MRLTSFHAPSPTARWSCFLFIGQHSSSIYLLHFPAVNYLGGSAISWEPFCGWKDAGAVLRSGETLAKKGL